MGWPAEQRVLTIADVVAHFLERPNETRRKVLFCADGRGTRVET